MYRRIKSDNRVPVKDRLLQKGIDIASSRHNRKTPENSKITKKLLKFQ